APADEPPSVPRQVERGSRGRRGALLGSLAASGRARRCQLTRRHTRRRALRPCLVPRPAPTLPRPTAAPPFAGERPVVHPLSDERRRALTYVGAGRRPGGEAPGGGGGCARLRVGV